MRVVLQLRFGGALLQSVYAYEQQRAVAHSQQAGRKEHAIRKGIHRYAASVLIELLAQQLEAERAERRPGQQQRPYEDSVARVGVEVLHLCEQPVVQAVFIDGVIASERRDGKGGKVRAGALHRVVENGVHGAAIRRPRAVLEKYAGVLLLYGHRRAVAGGLHQGQPRRVDGNGEEKRLGKVCHDGVCDRRDARVELAGADELIAKFTRRHGCKVQHELLDAGDEREAALELSLEVGRVLKVNVLDVDVVGGRTVHDSLDGRSRGVQPKAVVRHDAEAAVGCSLVRRNLQVLAYNVHEGGLRGSVARLPPAAAVRLGNTPGKLEDHLERARVEGRNDVCGVEKGAAE
mmetsp:Transcript_5104/g.14467  ORF Transcript_5104/g.14467 Transcript_5104/m.14467 type:complete len:347 (+) Transcript_5104:4102-5142(+)